MSITLIGVNHRTAPLALREQLALSGDHLQTALADLRGNVVDAEASAGREGQADVNYMSRTATQTPFVLSNGMTTTEGSYGKN